MESLFNKVRSKVSADKYRYQDGSHDLDLTYITDRFIAMAFPSAGLESTYRNPIDDVAEVCRENHGRYFLVYNLSERPYDNNKFDQQVITWCGFPDHLPPPWTLLLRVIHSIHNWLLKDPRNVVVVHCLAGKGRTGTIMACYFMYSGLFDTADEALNFFACKRSLNNWGVTGPAQLRYVYQFEKMLKSKCLPSRRPLLLRSISFHTIPRYTISPGKQGICPLFEIYSVSKEKQLIYSSERIGEELRSIPANLPGCTFSVNCVLQGDILIIFKHITPLYGTENMFFYVFHTGMVENFEMVLAKCELEKAHKDSRFAVDFTVNMSFTPLEEELASQFRPMEDKVEFSLQPEGGCDPAICFTNYVQEKISLARDLGNPLKGNTAEKGGYLTKRGHKVKNWKRRWFVLKEDQLSYLKSPRDAVPLGTIQLETIQKITMGVFAEKPFCFEIQTYNKTVYLISADTEKDMRAWAQAVAHARTLAKRADRQDSKKHTYTSTSAAPTAQTLPVKTDFQDHSFEGIRNTTTTAKSTHPAKHPSFSLSVTLLRARGLEHLEEVFCILSTDNESKTTSTLRNPSRFQESFEFVLADSQKELQLGLWHLSSGKRRPELVGTITIQLSHILTSAGHPVEDWWFVKTPEPSGGSLIGPEASIFIWLLYEQRQPPKVEHKEDEQFYASNQQQSFDPSQRITDPPISPINDRRKLMDTPPVISFQGWLEDELEEPSAMEQVDDYLWVGYGKTAGWIRIWNLKTKREVTRFAAHHSRISQVLAVNGRVWTASESDLKVWNAKSFAMQHQRTDVFLVRAMSLVQVPGMEISVWMSSSDDSSGWSVSAWQPDTFEQFEVLRIDHPVGCLHQSGDVVWIGSHTYIYLHDAVTRTRRRVLKAHKTMVRALVTTNSMVWSFSDDHASGIKAWNPETFEPLVTLEAVGRIAGIAAHAEHIFTSLQDGSILVWNSKTQKLEQQVKGDEVVRSMLVTKASLSPSGGQGGEWLVSACSSKIGIWTI